MLETPIALVTGAARGVGHGVAVGLARAGFKVYATGRHMTDAKFDVDVVGVSCDQTDIDGAQPRPLTLAEV